MGSLWLAGVEKSERDEDACQQSLADAQLFSQAHFTRCVGWMWCVVGGWQKFGRKDGNEAQVDELGGGPSQEELLHTWAWDVYASPMFLGWLRQANN